MILELYLYISFDEIKFALNSHLYILVEVKKKYTAWIDYTTSRILKDVTE